MLLKMVVQNLFSFGKQKEFNMFPAPKYKRLPHHKYQVKAFSVLKMASIYGANAAGKSNLIKAILLLKTIVLEGKIPRAMAMAEYKFFPKDKSSNQILAVEFIQNGRAFHYAIEIKKGKIIAEELYELEFEGDGKLIFERKTNKDSAVEIVFPESFKTDPKKRMLKDIIEKNLITPNKPLLRLLTDLEGDDFEDVRLALSWFRDTLQVVSPGAKPRSLVHLVETDEHFKKYAEDLICSFDTGVCKVGLTKQPLRQLISEEEFNLVKNQIENLTDTPDSDRVALMEMNRNGENHEIVTEGDTIYAKNIVLEQSYDNGVNAVFKTSELSDGTIRLIDFVPAIRNVVNKACVVIIDEIERSIHPLLIKEIVKKFSNDTSTNGQLIFTTHESNLLDQTIFRQDEVWFVEKDTSGNSDMYPLSDFKEHNTKDIRKGYLVGRYGSIPFLSNLADLNWNNNDSEEK